MNPRGCMLWVDVREKEQLAKERNELDIGDEGDVEIAHFQIYTAKSSADEVHLEMHDI